MENNELLKQETEAYLKYHQFKVEKRFILALYWYRKYKKITNMKKLANALIKRELKANGITKLNSIKI